MWILIIYILIVVVGESVVVGIGLVLDRTFPLASLPVSLTLFFAVLAFGWPLAVRWTEPKHAKRPKTRNLNLRDTLEGNSPFAPAFQFGLRKRLNAITRDGR